MIANYRELTSSGSSAMNVTSKLVPQIGAYISVEDNVYAIKNVVYYFSQIALDPMACIVYVEPTELTFALTSDKPKTTASPSDFSLDTNHDASCYPMEFFMEGYSSTAFYTDLRPLPVGDQHDKITINDLPYKVISIVTPSVPGGPIKVTVQPTALPGLIDGIYRMAIFLEGAISGLDVITGKLPEINQTINLGGLGQCIVKHVRTDLPHPGTALVIVVPHSPEEVHQKSHESPEPSDLLHHEAPGYIGRQADAIRGIRTEEQNIIEQFAKSSESLLRNATSDVTSKPAPSVYTTYQVKTTRRTITTEEGISERGAKPDQQDLVLKASSIMPLPQMKVVSKVIEEPTYSIIPDEEKNQIKTKHRVRVTRKRVVTEEGFIEVAAGAFEDAVELAHSMDDPDEMKVLSDVIVNVTHSNPN